MLLICPVQRKTVHIGQINWKLFVLLHCKINVIPMIIIIIISQRFRHYKEVNGRKQKKTAFLPPIKQPTIAT